MMKIDNEIEKSKKRITLLENQNVLFNKLLESALQVMNKSASKTSLDKDENEFWQETIALIENEKKKLQEDMSLLKDTEDEMSLNIKNVEIENIELQKKVEVLLEKTKFQDKVIENLKTELAEIKFLLTQPRSNVKWLESILKLDETLATNSSNVLLEKRQKLQKKIMNLERKKTHLFSAIEDITNPDNTRIDSQKIKADLEKALFKAIDEVAKRDLENLHVRVLELENERSSLLGQLQAILDDSRRKIAEEYCDLQRKILEIEKEKANLILTSKQSLNLETDSSDEALNHILNAFSNNQKTIVTSSVGRMDLKKSLNNQYKFPMYTCNLL